MLLAGAATIAGTILGVAGAPTAAAAEAEDDPPRIVVDDPSRPLPLLRDEAGRYFVRIRLEGTISEGFIATWVSQADGSPWTLEELARAQDFDAQRRCIRDAWATFAARFGSEAEWEDTPAWGPYGEDGYRSLVDPSALEAIDACIPWFAETQDAVFETQDDGGYVVFLPVDRLGHGAQTLWLAPTIYRPRTTFEVTLGDGTTRSVYSTLLEVRPAMSVDVVVPEPPTTDRRLEGTGDEPGTWFDQSGFSDLPALAWGEAGPVEPTPAQPSGPGTTQGPTAPPSDAPSSEPTPATSPDPRAEPSDEETGRSVVTGRLTEVRAADTVVTSAGWFAPQRPPYLVWSLLGGLALALLVGIPSWVLERRAQAAPGAAALRVRTMFGLTADAPRHEGAEVDTPTTTFDVLGATTVETAAHDVPPVPLPPVPFPDVVIDPHATVEPDASVDPHATVEPDDVPIPHEEGER